MAKAWVVFNASPPLKTLYCLRRVVHQPLQIRSHNVRVGQVLEKAEGEGEFQPARIASLTQMDSPGQPVSRHRPADGPPRTHGFSVARWLWTVSVPFL